MTIRIAAVVEQSWHRVPGGTATSTVRVLDALSQRSDVDVQGIAAWHRAETASEVRPTVPVKHVPLPRVLMYDAWQQLRRPRVQRFTGAVDVVHATGGVVPPAGDAALVVTLHDLAFMHRPEHFTPRGVKFLTRAFNLARDDADAIICPSQASADDCVAHGIDRDRVTVVPWGVEPAALAPGASARVRATYELPERFVLWVGTLEPRKNLQRLAAAVESMEGDTPLVIVGPDGWGDVAADVTGENLSWLGFVPDADLQALYNAATVFCYPSLLEGFGMPVLEAMAHSTPVVTSAGTATEEVLGDGGIAVDPERVDEIAAALHTLLGDADRHEAASHAAQERAAEFTWERTARETVAVYEQAIARRQR